MPSQCIPWTGRINDQGYGTIGIELAHRRAWSAERGLIPEGATIDHICHDPDVCRLGRECPHRSCVNVEHMVLVTGAENASRGHRRAREITHCPEGHEYAGDNLAMYEGRRHCRTCRRTQEQARRTEQKAARCRSRGHERIPVTIPDGREYCAVCQAHQGRRYFEARSQAFES